MEVLAGLLGFAAFGCIVWCVGTLVAYFLQLVILSSQPGHGKRIETKWIRISAIATACSLVALWLFAFALSEINR